MNILVACESSGLVRDAFIARGHNALSCDFDETERPGPHVRGNVEDLMYAEWDMIIAFPPCTHLACSGARWLTDHWVKSKKHPEGRYWHDGAVKRWKQKNGIDFFMAIANNSCPQIAIENPVGVMSTMWRKPDQYIQPWQFGHGETKKTGLWLKGLPPLTPTNIVEGREQRIWKMGPGEKRAVERSRTYVGVAQAMAAQWG